MVNKSEQFSCSVLMSAYNGELYIRQQIDSILHQLDVKVNLYIRDDGSSDDTKSILKEYSDKYKENVTVFFEENKGIHGSFSQLINLPNLDGYIAFADQDDVWDSDKLITAIKKINCENADLYFSSSRLVDSELNYLNKSTESVKQYYHYLKGNNKILTPGVQGCTMVMTNVFFHTVVNRGYPAYYGHDTWIPIVAFYTSKTYYDPEPHMSYRQHNNSWTGNRKNRFSQLRKEFNYFISGMQRYSALATDILKEYPEYICDAEKEILVLLAKQNKGLRDRIRLIFSHNLNKFGIFQNLLFKWELLMGNI